MITERSQVMLEYSVVPYLSQDRKDEESFQPGCTQLLSIGLLENGDSKYNFESPRKKRRMWENWKNRQIFYLVLNDSNIISHFFYHTASRQAPPPAGVHQCKVLSEVLDILVGRKLTWDSRFNSMYPIEVRVYIYLLRSSSVFLMRYHNY